MRLSLSLCTGFIFSLSSLAWAGPDAQCAKKIAKVFSTSTAFALEEARQEYNFRIAKSMGEAGSRAELEVEVQRIVELTKKLSPQFRDRDFLAFLKSQPAVEPRRMKGSGSIGEFIAGHYQAFAGPFTEMEKARKALQNGTAELVSQPKLLKERCGKSRACWDLGIRKIPATLREKLAGTCIARSPMAMAALGRDLALTWGVMATSFIAGDSHQIQDFPAAFLSNSTIWAAIFEEKACRKALSRPAVIGKPVRFLEQRGFKKQTLDAIRDEVSYLKWYPLAATSLVGLSYGINEFYGKDLSPEEYGIRWGFSVVYNSVSGPIRRVLVMDPLFVKVFPKFAGVVEQLAKNGRVATWVTQASAGMVEFSLRLGELEIWNVANQGFLKTAREVFGMPSGSVQAAPIPIKTAEIRAPEHPETVSELPEEFFDDLAGCFAGEEALPE